MHEQPSGAACCYWRACELSSRLVMKLHWATEATFQSLVIRPFCALDRDLAGRCACSENSHRSRSDRSPQVRIGKKSRRLVNFLLAIPRFVAYWAGDVGSRRVGSRCRTGMSALDSDCLDY